MRAQVLSVSARKLGAWLNGAVPCQDLRLREQAAADGGEGHGYESFWKIWLPLLVAFVVLDLTFDLYFWRIPKLSRPNVDYGYQFLLDARALAQPAPTGHRRALAFGSSVALSFDARQVRSLLEASRPDERWEARRLLLPGIHPSDYLLFFRALEMPRPPEVVVVLINLVDFLYPNTERDVNPTLRFILPPWELLRQRHEHMSFTSELDLVLSGSSRLYRYRKVVRSSLHGHMRALLRWLRSGPVTAPQGIYPDGYTRQRFVFPAGEGSVVEIEYFIDPEWLRQRGRIELQFSTAGRLVAAREETEAGWKKVTLEVPAVADGWLEVTADSAWTPRAGGGKDARLLGVRLRHPPPASGSDGSPPFHFRDGFEGEMVGFLRMGGTLGEDFARRWDETLNAGTRFGQRFRLYRDAKLKLTEQQFTAGGEYEAVRRLAEHFTARGSSVIIINTPESPWILERYRERPYYRAYLQYFRDLAASMEQVHFHDWSDALPPEDFNDWHHPSYVGAIKLGSRYAQAITAALAPR